MEAVVDHPFVEGLNNSHEDKIVLDDAKPPVVKTFPLDKRTLYLSKDDIIDAVYRKPMPNRFLASFSKFIYQNLKEQFVIDLVAGCFDLFFDKYICRYPTYREVKLSCTGSVAFYYSNILRAVAANKGVNMDTISETPIAGLTLYHLEE